MFDIQSSDAILAARLGVSEATIRARLALNEGCEAFSRGDIATAIRDFTDAKRLAVEPTPGDATKSTARLYLASMYFTRHWPGLFKTAEDNQANQKWLDMARVEYQEVLASGADERDREYAEQGLRTLRQ